MDDDQRIRLGPDDAFLDPGDHVCALFRGSEGRDAVLLPFLQAAVEQGDKVVGLLEDEPPAAVLDRIEPDDDPSRVARFWAAPG